MKKLDDRQAMRLDADGEVRLRQIFTRGAAPKEVRGLIRNVSATGLCITPESPVEVGTLADLELQLDGQPLAHTLGLIRWADPATGVGIEFFYGTEEERDALQHYILAWAARQSGGS